jgi:hypothetical protein
MFISTVTHPHFFLFLLGTTSSFLSIHSQTFSKTLFTSRNQLFQLLLSESLFLSFGVCYHWFSWNLHHIFLVYHNILLFCLPSVFNDTFFGTVVLTQDFVLARQVP